MTWKKKIAGTAAMFILGFIFILPVLWIVIIRKTPHPSIAAASSSSRGTFFKNPVNVRIPNAQKNPISRMIIPPRELVRLVFVASTEIGIITA